MNKTKKVRSVVAVIFAFLLSLCIFALSVSCVAKLTALNPSYAKRILVKSGFGESKLKELRTELVSYANACNIGGDFFDAFFETTLTADFVEKDASDYYGDLYNNKKAKPDSSRLEKELKPALVTYARENGYNDENLDEDLNVIVSEMGEIYSNILSLPASSTVYSLISRLTKYVNLALIASAAGFAFFTLLLVFMFKPKVHTARHLIYAFSGAFLMLLVCPLCVRIANIIGKVNIVSKALYSFVVAFGNGVLNGVLIASAICLCITLALALIYKKLSKAEE